MKPNVCMPEGGPAKSLAEAAAASRCAKARALLFLLRNEGQSMVEFALTLPIMLLIVTGICTFGIAMNNYLLLTDATNAGARQLSILRGQASDPCATVVSTVKGAAPLLVANNLTFTFTIDGTTYNGNTCTAGATGLNNSQGDPTTLKVTYPCTIKVYGANLVPGCMLTAQTAELVQ